MFLRRFRTSLQSQHWAAFWIDIVVLVIGVFLGIQASNWNERRLEKRETEKLLAQLRPELHDFVAFLDSTRTYYRVTSDFAQIAFAGWERNPSVSDEQFVIAAYQASQIYGFGANMENWALVFGGEQLRNLDDPELRSRLSSVMTADYSLVHISAMRTKYREDIRRAIPDDVQSAIRAKCGDRPLPGKLLGESEGYQLPTECDPDLSAEKMKVTAERLRASPQLAEELRWHQAAVATYMQNVDAFQSQIRALAGKLDEVV